MLPSLREGDWPSVCDDVNCFDSGVNINEASPSASVSVRQKLKKATQG